MHFKYNTSAAANISCVLTLVHTLWQQKCGFSCIKYLWWEEDGNIWNFHFPT